MGNESSESLAWDSMVSLHRLLKNLKPEERSELSRRYAVTITEFEKVMGYFNMMVIQDFEHEPNQYSE